MSASEPGTKVHPNALVEAGATVGAGTRVWAFVHVLPGAVVGQACNLCDHVFVEGGVTIGDRVTIKSGVQLWSGIRLEDDVFVGPNATFTNDRFPRSRDHSEPYAPTVVKKGATIGANATIVAGCTVGAGAMVGAGAVVTKDVPPNAIVVGNPARIAGYVSSTHKGAIDAAQPSVSEASLPVEGVRLLHLPVQEDLRGKLSYAEVGGGLPFAPQRYFIMFDVPTSEVRGEHAHKALEQVFVCLKGSVELLLDDGRQRSVVRLEGPGLAVYVPPLIWTSHYKYTPDALLLVLASQGYDAADYVRSYDEFLALRKTRR